jgi:hypothetical protein
VPVSVDPGPQLLDVIADLGIVLLIALGPLDKEWGHSTADDGVIAIAPSLADADPRALAALLAHARAHAQRDVNGQAQRDEDRLGLEAACVADQHAANVNELLVWERLVGRQGKEPAANEYEAQLNDELVRYQRSPERFAASANRRHSDQCRE